jgi:hypothetical protein
VESDEPGEIARGRGDVLVEVKDVDGEEDLKIRRPSDAMSYFTVSTETPFIVTMDDTWMVVLPTTASGNAGTIGWSPTRIQCTTRPKGGSAIGACQRWRRNLRASERGSGTRNVP